MSKLVELEQLKNRIETLISLKAQTEGQLKLLYEKLRQEGFESIEEAEEELDKLKKQYQILDAKCNKLIEEIERELEDME